VDKKVACFVSSDPRENAKSITKFLAEEPANPQPNGVSLDRELEYLIPGPLDKNGNHVVYVVYSEY
jgi:hypothetical protein